MEVVVLFGHFCADAQVIRVVVIEMMAGGGVGAVRGVHHRIDQKMGKAVLVWVPAKVFSRNDFLAGYDYQSCSLCLLKVCKSETLYSYGPILAGILSMDKCYIGV